MFSPLSVCFCLLIAGILQISAIMLVGCVCHSVCLCVCLFVYPVVATVSVIMTKLGTDVGHGPTQTLVVFGESKVKGQGHEKTEILIFAITSAKMVVSTSNQIQNVHLPILHPTICLIGGVTPTPFLAVGGRLSGASGQNFQIAIKTPFQVRLTSKL